jgi:hypothetical protein
MKLLLLTQGKAALVDDADWDRKTNGISADATNTTTSILPRNRLLTNIPAFGSI